MTCGFTSDKFSMNDELFPTWSFQKTIADLNPHKNLHVIACDFDNLWRSAEQLRFDLYIYQMTSSCDTLGGWSN